MPHLPYTRLMKLLDLPTEEDVVNFLMGEKPPAACPWPWDPKPDMCGPCSHPCELRDRTLEHFAEEFELEDLAKGNDYP